MTDERRTPQEQCDAFNAVVKVGDPVEVIDGEFACNATVNTPAFVSLLGYARVTVKTDHEHLLGYPEIRNVRSRSQSECNAFNAVVSPGDEVEVRPIFGIPYTTRLSAPAYLRDGRAVVLLMDGLRYLDSVHPIEPAKPKPTEPTLDDLIREAMANLPYGVDLHIHLKQGKVTIGQVGSAEVSIAKDYVRHIARQIRERIATLTTTEPAK